MQIPDVVEGCPVVDGARSRDPRFPWVVICELPQKSESSDRYVVWYVDQEGDTNSGIYTQILDEARAAFEARVS